MLLKALDKSVKTPPTTKIIAYTFPPFFEQTNQNILGTIILSISRIKRREIFVCNRNNHFFSNFFMHFWERCQKNLLVDNSIYHPLSSDETILILASSGKMLFNKLSLTAFDNH